MVFLLIHDPICPAHPSDLPVRISPADVESRGSPCQVTGPHQHTAFPGVSGGRTSRAHWMSAGTNPGSLEGQWLIDKKAGTFLSEKNSGL